MLLLSHATLIEAIYEGVKRKPDNKFIKQTVQDGVNTKVFRGNTPKFICTYLKDLHNQFHKGAQTSFLELYELAAAYEKEWNQHCKACDSER